MDTGHLCVDVKAIIITFHLQDLLKYWIKHESGV